MRRVALRVNLIACVLACASVAPAAAGGARGRVAGNDEALWIVRPTMEQKRLGVVALPTGGSWRWVLRKGSPPPRAVAAVGTQLHMLFPDGAFWAVGLHTEPLQRDKPDLDNWPQTPRRVVLLEGQGFARAPNRDSVVALVSRAAPSASTRPAETASSTTTRPTTATGPATAPASRAAIAPTGAGVALGVFQLAPDGWVHLDDVPGTVGDEALSGVRAATAGQVLYVYLPDRRVLLGGDPGESWRRIGLGDLAELLTEGELLALLSVKSQLSAVAAGPDGALHVATYLPSRSADGDGRWRVEPIRRDGEPFVAPGDAPPHVARMGDDLVALVWRDGETVRLASCDLSGRMTQRRDVDILTSPPPPSGGQKIFEYFMWGVLVAILIPMFLLRPQAPRGPFAVPRRRPGHLGKRLLAGLIDLVPWVFLSWTVFRPPVPADPWKQLKEAVQSPQPMAPALAYFAIASLAMYVGYCIVLEMRLGQTVGKRLMRLAVVNEQGRRPNLREALLRNLVKIIELSMPIAIPLLLLVPLLTRWRQRLGDMLARTAVIDADYLGPAEDEDQSDGSEQGGTNGKGGSDTTAGDDPQSGYYGSHGRTDHTRDD
ncbi:MAG: RDD family protein [Planctomycetota bacterium]